MKLSILGLLISSTLCGCAIFDEEYSNEINDKNLQTPYPTNTSSPSTMTAEAKDSFHNHYKQRLDIAKMDAEANHDAEAKHDDANFKNRNINHYVRGIMQDMVGNLQDVNSTTPVAVTSFVFLDGPYDKASLLGNQIAESFIHEIRKFNIPVLDFKTMDFIRITPEGDFVQNRDFEELSNTTQISYIVTGTLVKHQGGYLVNARMIGLKSKVVVASAQSLIPDKIANALMSSQNDQTGQAPKVSLVQG